jgi:hypothetical protein
MEAESKINAKIVGCGLINNFAASHLWDDSTYACRRTVSALAQLDEATDETHKGIARENMF